jgi:hypothetical protein
MAVPAIAVPAPLTDSRPDDDLDELTAADRLGSIRVPDWLKTAAVEKAQSAKLERAQSLKDSVIAADQPTLRAGSLKSMTNEVQRAEWLRQDLEEDDELITSEDRTETSFGMPSWLRTFSFTPKTPKEPEVPPPQGKASSEELDEPTWLKGASSSLLLGGPTPRVSGASTSAPLAESVPEPATMSSPAPSAAAAAPLVDDATTQRVTLDEIRRVQTLQEHAPAVDASLAGDTTTSWWNFFQYDPFETKSFRNGCTRGCFSV